MVGVDMDSERISKLEALADAVREWIVAHDELMKVRNGREWFLKSGQVRDAEWKMESMLCKLDDGVIVK